MYEKLNWIDEVKDQKGNVVQKGTPLSARNMNNIENGIFESNLLGAMLSQHNMQQKRVLADLEGEIGQTALINTEVFPFNNSIKTIVLSKNRDTIDYRITVEVISKNENVGEVIVSDKQLNGFKLNFTGSTQSVTIKYYVQGGMYQ